MDLKTLTQLSGVSGNEIAVRKAVYEACKPLCDNVTIDKMGNVLAFKKGTKANAPHVALAAHMDEVGFIITSATEEGLLRFLPIGGVDPRVVISKQVLVGEEKIPGIIGAMAIHLQTPEDRQRVLGYTDLYIDIGAKTKEDALKNCDVGSYVVFDSPYTEFGEGFVMTKALDDRVGCYTLLETLKEEYPVDITCIFNTSEEVGCRGAEGSAYATDSQIALILEGTTCNDMGDVAEGEKVCRAGKGVTVSFMDNASIGYVPLYKALLALGKEKGIACQKKESVSGGNESVSFQQSKGGQATCAVSVPCRYIHGPSSVASLADIQAQLELVKAFLHSEIPQEIVNGINGKEQK
ncbi:MAG: M42 family metallopeptidase [Clostridiales bacterium]|nr:M42 family metallopeptidase [Clostridiales bacterium]